MTLSSLEKVTLRSYVSFLTSHIFLFFYQQAQRTPDQVLGEAAFEVQTAGQVVDRGHTVSLGLALIGVGVSGDGTIAFMVSSMAFALVAAGLVLLLLPETGGRELEAISGERAA